MTLLVGAVRAAEHIGEDRTLRDRTVAVFPDLPQITTFNKWAMLGSNQRPLPCEVSTIVCWRFLELAKFLQTVIFLRQCFSQHFSSFTQVAARLLHRRYCPHPHKARHNFYPSRRLKTTCAIFV
jgi:hypothetical protein